MPRPGINIWLLVLATLPALSSSAQAQSCPANINFSAGTLSQWSAYTGNNKDGNGPGAIRQVYYPSQTVSAISEYLLSGVNGITVITYQGTDPFGGFNIIPTINGYAYHYSVLLGSTSVAQRQTMDQNNGNGSPNNPPSGGQQGGYVRGITYLINVPAGASAQPYTITYAYAMVLENGAHASQNQPMARAIVTTPGGVISCASPSYFLPTYGGGLDSAAAQANGFSASPVPTPNESRNPATPGLHLQDVWTKDWTEVTFDLSPYRGQQVSLTFEADNCVPGGHFAYAYFALRDECAGLQISGDSLACSNSVGTYSIPSVDSAIYNWSVPDGWALRSSTNGNTIDVTIGPQSGWVVAHAKNSCTDLTDSFFVRLYEGALPQVTVERPDTAICFGETASLHAIVTTGTEYTWASQESITGQSKGDISSLPFTTAVVTTPASTANYILHVRNAGCPIIISDTFKVTVVPPVQVNPGNDTLVVVNQPLQFHATSNDPFPATYEWTPSTDLSNPNIANPIGVYGSEISGITYQVRATDIYGCTGAASVKVVIATAAADFYVPNAFTPEKSANNIFRPVCMGISTLEYFRVYSRWGQLMYSTSQPGQGWDGRVGGKLQETNAYLWILRGTDYTGRVIIKKGTVMLVR